MQQQDANAGWNNNGWNDERRGSGFWPADVAAGAVGTAAGIAGAAVGTAGAIATAPFRTADAYAYDNRYAAGPGPGPMTYDRGENGWYGDWNSYAAHNGMVCRPGTMFKDGDRMRPLPVRPAHDLQNQGRPSAAALFHGLLSDQGDGGSFAPPTLIGTARRLGFMLHVQDELPGGSS